MSTDVMNETLQILEQPLSDSAYLAETTRLLSVVVFVYKPEQRLLQYNPSQLAVELGYAQNILEPESFKLTDLLHEDDRQSFDAFLQKLSEASAQQLECRFLNSNGNYMVYHIKALTAANGEDVIISATSAVSVLTKTDKHLVHANNTIDQLQNSNRELEDFAYVASHDLQAPLRKISTFSDRLQEKFANELNEEGRMYLDRIIASAENMRMFIDNLLDFSRITRVREPFSEVDLNNTLRQVKNDFEIVIEETGTVIKADSLPKLDGNAAQLKQLFANIISNAIKFRRPNVKPEITINVSELTAEDKKQFGAVEGIYYRIEVCDNGIGFEPEYAKRIFEVFERLHGKSEYPGTGIGLAICKKIVAYHKGQLTANNNIDNGACFNIVLPASQA